MNIRKHGKLLIVIICTLILAAVIATAVVVRNAAVRKKDRKPVITIEEEKTEYYNGLPIGWVYADYDFSPYDYRNLVGDADYVFVGKVIENKGVIYENIQTVVGEGGVKYTFSDPFTVYSVEVEKNIKGELAERIEIEKDGGLAQSGERYTIIENDILPEVGERYIFSAYAQDDGSLIASGACSSIPYSEEELEKMEEAAANPTDFENDPYAGW